MEIIKLGTEVVNEMASLCCCWPPGTMTWAAPEPE